jgi:hypothetical protein
MLTTLYRKMDEPPDLPEQQQADSSKAGSLTKRLKRHHEAPLSGSENRSAHP